MTNDQRHSVSGMRPNILLITTDSQRCDTLSYMGNEHAHSPNLDRLAAEGTMFTDAHTACPVCMPARCSLLTGTHAQTHGVIENGIAPRDYLTIFPDLLHEAGYTTIMVGKTHTGLLRPTYDHACIIQGEKGGRTDDPYTAFLSRHGRDRGDVDPATLPDELHMDAFLVDETIAAMDNAIAGSEAPFFAHCSLLSPHEPLDPPGAWADLYRDRSLPPVNYRPGELDEHPAHMHEVLGLRYRTDTDRFFAADGTLRSDEVDAHRARYFGLAAYCDALVGRLISFLDENDLRSRTLVIFTSDHGTQLFDHGFDDKHCFYDASWRVPFVVSMPGTVPRSETRGFASWVDIAPTILAAAGLACPTMQGLDLFAPLATGANHPRRGAASTLYASCALVTRRWKLEWYLEDARGRLFDRLADPDEQENLIDDETFAHVRDHLLISLLTWRADTTDLQWLQRQTSGGGPVARQAAMHTARMRGNDPEQRLNTRIAGMEDAAKELFAPPVSLATHHRAPTGVPKEQPQWQ
jgi:arylsulfatase